MDEASASLLHQLPFRAFRVIVASKPRSDRGVVTPWYDSDQGEKAFLNEIHTVEVLATPVLKLNTAIGMNTQIHYCTLDR